MNDKNIDNSVAAPIAGDDGEAVGITSTGNLLEPEENLEKPADFGWFVAVVRCNCERKIAASQMGESREIVALGYNHVCELYLSSLSFSNIAYFKWSFCLKFSGRRLYKRRVGMEVIWSRTSLKHLAEIAQYVADNFGQNTAGKSLERLQKKQTLC